MYPILIIVLALIFYFRRFNFQISLQKSVVMKPSLRLIDGEEFFGCDGQLAYYEK